MAKSNDKSNLRKHAEYELKLAGLDSPDSDYEGKLAEASLELIDTFSKQRHSGSSANIVMQLFYQLAQFRPLTPLTDDPDEWQSVTDEMDLGRPMWQSKRYGSAFSEDGGKTYYDVSEPGDNKQLYRSEPHNKKEDTNGKPKNSGASSKKEKTSEKIITGGSPSSKSGTEQKSS